MVTMPHAGKRNALRVHGKEHGFKEWIPACAGMTERAKESS
jgi:hypothetical protein